MLIMTLKNKVAKCHAWHSERNFRRDTFSTFPFSFWYIQLLQRWQQYISPIHFAYSKILVGRWYKCIYIYIFGNEESDINILIELVDTEVNFLIHLANSSIIMCFRTFQFWSSKDQRKSSQITLESLQLVKGINSELFIMCLVLKGNAYFLAPKVRVICKIVPYAPNPKHSLREESTVTF